MLPTLFLSHGAPTLAISATPASDFLRSLAARLPKPKAVLIASGHWEEAAPSLGLGLETVHDFYGFPEGLYRLQYPAPAAREVAKRALHHNAASVIFAHNHPSGVAEQSRADELLTTALKQALALVDVRVLDHFVIAGDGALSFAERGLL